MSDKIVADCIWINPERVTGVLKVYDENGNPIYSGPPEGYWG